MHKVALPTEEGWEDFRLGLGSNSRNLLCFTKTEMAYQEGTPANVHFIAVEQGRVIYMPCWLELDMILAQAPEEIFLVGLSEVGRQNLLSNWSNPETLRNVIEEEYPFD